jgi:hypothetical protein
MQGILDARFLTSYSWSLVLWFTDLNQMNDNLNETSIQNALKMGANSSAENTSCTQKYCGRSAQ